MTEVEWLAETCPFGLLTAQRVVVTPRKMQLFGEDVEVRDTVRSPLISFTPRKIRLFAVACCRRASARLPPGFLDLLLEVEQEVDALKDAVDLSSLHAKGSRELEQLREAERSNYRPGVFSAAETVVLTAHPDVSPVELGVNVTNNLACSAGELARPADEENRWTPEVEAADDAESAAHCAIFRDIFGNPFRPVAVNPAWQMPNVLALAQAAYDNRTLPAGTLEPARLAILADALEDAGCDNADIMNHLRQPGEHVRGCWVIDQLLGKE